MQTFEWLTLIGVIVTGFWTLSQKLGDIEKALSGKVTFEICHNNRHECPLRDEIASIKKAIEKENKHEKKD